MLELAKITESKDTDTKWAVRFPLPLAWQLSLKKNNEIFYFLPDKISTYRNS